MPLGSPDFNKESIMTTAAKNPRKEEKPAGFVGFVQNSYRKTMDASELVSLTAVNLPYMFLEALGVPEERTKGLKGINERFVGGVYKGTDWVTTRAVGAYIAPFKWVGNGVSRLATGRRPAAKKAPKKAEAKKPAPKKVAKKAPKAKKAPPKVARRPVKAKGRAAAKLAA
jgi:hypothetical protein